MNNQCINRIRNIYRAIGAFEIKLEKNFQLNINEVMLLSILLEHDSLLSGELADELGISRSNASKVIVSLEKKQLISRETCKKDTRCQRFSITEEGRERMSHINCESFAVPDNLQELVKIR